MILIFLLIQIFANTYDAKSQTFELRGGYSLFPGLYTALRNAHPSNSDINLAGGYFLESANKNNLCYRCNDAEVLAQYS